MSVILTMANDEHLEKLFQGVKVWNTWRSENLEILPDLSKADLRWEDLEGADLSKADLSGANLNGADLSEADLSWANLEGADLIQTNLHGADLIGADLREACLPLAICSFANFELAILNKTHLWGIQREHWSIKGIQCSSVYWDEKAETLTQYADGDFERLFSDKTKIQIFYKGGLNTLEIVSLPAFIQHLESLHQGCKLRFQSITEASGGAIVEIVVDEGDELQSVIEQEASLSQQKLRTAFEQREQFLLGELAGFERGVKSIFKEMLPLMSNNPTIHINSPIVHGTLAGYVQGDVIYNAAQLADAGKLVETLTAKVDSIPSLEPDQRQELNQALTTAKTELEKPQPSHPVVQSAISVVRSILEKSAAQWLTSHAGDIWEALQKLPPHLPM